MRFYNELAIEQIGGFCDLMLTVTETEKGYQAAWTYDRKNQEHIQQWHTFFLEVLQQFCVTDEHELAQFPLLSQADKTLIDDVNNTAVEYPQTASLVHLMAETFVNNAQQTALQFQQQSMSYQQLDQVSNHLARQLLEHGVEPGNFVGLCMNRSIEMVTALVAILKAGGAFVPLDPAYPSSRLQQMVADADMTIVLTHQQTQSIVKKAVDAAVVCLKFDMATLPDSLSEPLFEPLSELQPKPINRARLDKPAYMLYTSGSTGKPKGVVIEHAAIINRLQWMQAEYQLTTAHTVLQKTPYSFDVSVWEFFWPLITGAKLVIAEPEGHKNPEYLLQLIQQQQITHLHFVPSMLSIYLDFAYPQANSSLQQVFCSGEALMPKQVERFYQHYPQAELHNLYGPTEAAIDVSYYACQAADAQRASIPIGKPVANTQLYILDGAMQAVPVGCEGDLYIAGVQLSSGYYQREQLNAELFLDFPLEQTRQRVYKTGDLARWNQQGEIEYLGRSDFQVKIRGQRIELGEIDAALLQQTVVQNAASLIDANRDTPIIIAFIVVEERVAAEALDSLSIESSLRHALVDCLPIHMVPTAFCFVTELPITSNGKLDRKSLLQQYAKQELALSIDSNTDLSHSEPQAILPVLLAAWHNILEYDTAQSSDNFFLVGGDSIKALRLLSELQANDLVLDVQMLYRHPTLGTLNSLLLDKQSSDKSTAILAEPIKPFALIESNQSADLFIEQWLTETGKVEDIYPLTALQEVMYSHSVMRPNAAMYHDVFCVHLTRALDTEQLQYFIQQLTLLHPALRTRLVVDANGDLMQTVLTTMVPEYS